MTTEFSSIVGKGCYPTIDNLLDSFHNSASTADLRTYFGCFAPEGRFLGTDASENWSASEFYTYAKPHFDRGTGWTYVPEVGTRRYHIFPSESQPVFASFDELLSSASFKATSRGSGTVAFDAQRKSWLIIAYHLTFPIPNDMAADMCKKIAAFESKNKVMRLNQDAEAKAEAAAAELLEMCEAESSHKQDLKKGKGKGKGKK